MRTCKVTQPISSQTPLEVQVPQHPALLFREAPPLDLGPEQSWMAFQRKHLDSRTQCKSGVPVGLTFLTLLSQNLYLNL